MGTGGMLGRTEGVSPAELEWPVLVPSVGCSYNSRDIKSQDFQTQGLEYKLNGCSASTSVYLNGKVHVERNVANVMATREAGGASTCRQ